MAHEMIGTQIVTERLVALLESGTEKVLLIDSRPFVEYNTSHILEAININCSKLMKRRLQQDKVLITELIQHSAKHKVDLDCSQKVVVYDQSSQDVASLASDCFLTVLLGKLEKSFIPTCISQPCLPELMQQNGIGYVLNASNTCPKPDFIPESHFLLVPVNDSFCEKILPWLDKSVDFIEKAKASNGCVLVHCLAGISRSATIAIAYIMKRMDMSLDEAYRFPTPGAAGTRRAPSRSSSSVEAARWSSVRASGPRTGRGRNWARWAASQAFQAAWKSSRSPDFLYPLYPWKYINHIQRI
uniref:Dual specificity phosphatase 16 n=1 Tax=Moschus moschiferus TaxID=68415 RepID=A0A8C6MGU3_MOSMO